MSIFERSVACSLFFRNCNHRLTRTHRKKFEDMFLVKIASKGTSLKCICIEIFFITFYWLILKTFKNRKESFLPFVDISVPEI